jgi:hypothetical protein
MAVAVPLGRPAEGGVQDPAGERVDEAGAFGQGDELSRPEQAVVGMLPAHQRLRAQDPAGPQIRLGLVVEDQLVAFQGPPQAAEEGQAPRAVLVDRGGRRP